MIQYHTDAGREERLQIQRQAQVVADHRERAHPAAGDNLCWHSTGGLPCINQRPCAQHP